MDRLCIRMGKIVKGKLVGNWQIDRLLTKVDE